MTSEHEPAHHTHRAGPHWLDLTLALCAMLVSVVSLIVAVRHGATMEGLVAANSWPFLTYSTDNEDPEGRHRITLKVINAGVGPARIQTFELWWHDQPMTSAADLLERCCGLKDKPGPGEGSLRLLIGAVAPTVLRAGDTEEFISLERLEENSDAWQRLNAARMEIRMRVCYCSVFDECWVTDLRQNVPKRVSSCPDARVPFGIPEHWFKVTPQPAATPN